MDQKLEPCFLDLDLATFQDCKFFFLYFLTLAYIFGFNFFFSNIFQTIMLFSNNNFFTCFDFENDYVCYDAQNFFFHETSNNSDDDARILHFQLPYNYSICFNGFAF